MSRWASRRRAGNGADRRLLVVALATAIALVVAYQVTTHYHQQRVNAIASQSNIPRMAPGTDPLAGVTVVAARKKSYDYKRWRFGEAWSDETDAPGGHNGCSTRDDVLNRDLTDKTVFSSKTCSTSVRSGVLHDPYTGKVVNYIRGPQTGQSVQIDHIVPLAYAWDMGASKWEPSKRWRFANDPANLVAVDGDANFDKADQGPSRWMPPNRAFWCQYAMQFAEVVRGYGLSIDEGSARTIYEAVRSCPT